VQVGGSDFSELNSFAGALNADGVPSAAILLGANSNQAEIVRNFIGFGANGTLEGRNAHGIHASGLSHIIDQNVIGNNDIGILLVPAAQGISITNNRIGLPAFCFFQPCTASGNLVGVRIEGSDNALASNTTAYNSGPGVRVEGNGNTISNHLAYGNGTVLVPPIDIAGAGFTPNDNDTDPNPPSGNRGQNFPLIDRADFNLSPQLGRVQGTLNSRNGRYRISIYGGDRVLDLARCESNVSIWSGEIEITNGTATSNGGGVFIANVLKTVSAGKQLSATATRIETITNGIDYTDTSEIGPCFEAPLFTDGFENFDL
jgi:hypothetical protein